MSDITLDVTVNPADYYAGPRCVVEIYPHEGGMYAIEGGKDQILSCSVRKNIKEPAGSFRIVLAPGGPNGPDVGPSWLDIITPMSFVKIGMMRGSFRGIVMLGVVTRCDENWDFLSKPVTRSVIVTGQDLGYFFTHFSWYALTFINAQAAALGIAAGNQQSGGALGTPAGMQGQLTQGSPDQIGKAWYQGVMDGDNGILSRTWFDNALNSSILFSKAVTVKFEKFSDDVKIFWTFSFISAEETWWQKFNRIFPWPWYEFFTMTAPDGFYDTALTSSWTDVAGGSTFTMEKLPGLSARMYVIARVNPLPILKATPGSPITFGPLDTKAWNGLPSLSESGIRLLRTQEEFCEEEVRNFYIINPTFMKSLLGQGNGDVVPPMLAALTGGVAVDPASVHRYGFRPAYMETEWFADPDGTNAAQGQMNFPQVIADLVARLASQYEPVSLMMRAERIGVLRPDIIPGSRFTYQPLKELATALKGGGNSGLWTFYVDGVFHHYEFGENATSTTTLTLSRGLPSDVYGDTGALNISGFQVSGGVLEALHRGLAQRLSGVYQLGLPSGSDQTETGLTGVSMLPQQLEQLLYQIAPIYSTALMK